MYRSHLSAVASPSTLPAVGSREDFAPPAPAGESAGASESPQFCPLLDVVACDGADTSPIVVAAHSLGAEVRLASTPDLWFEQQEFLASESSAPPADVVALIGSGERLTTQRLVARAVQKAPDTQVLAVVVDATLDQAASVVNQGARGLICLPGPADRIGAQLREILVAASDNQQERRAAVRHRNNLGKLTQAEQDVLDHMLEGMANKQIAQRLGIGLRTVELRRSKIMKKMNAMSIAQLVDHVYAAKPQGS